MKKTVYVFLLVFTLFLSALAVIAVTKDDAAADPLIFQVQTEKGEVQIRPFIDAEGKYQMFLPANSKKDALTVQAAQEVMLNGAILTDGSRMAWPEMETFYTLTIGGKETQLQFRQASNVATMYIETRSGTMDHIHANQNYAEGVSVTLYDKDGILNYFGEVDTLKGRGNATWACDKKPYALTLRKQADLLGMGCASGWVLLANALDESNLHNKLAFTIAKQADLGWSPDCAYVELYLNGSYNGLYLLTEKVECGVNRLDIDLSEGDFLATVEPNMRLAVLDHPIRTRQGRVIDLCEPEFPTSQEQARIEQLTEKLEDAIFSAPQGAFPEMLDMDSWAKRYLVDEICANIDADLASSYFYCKDGKFFAGPVWDYDMSFGNQITNENPETFLAKSAVRSRKFATPYDTVLLENDAFYTRVTELYRKQFLPALEQLLQFGIQDLAEEISAATEMNSLRWQAMFEKNPVATTTAEGVRSYLEKRVEFLSSAWVDGIDYCTVQFEVMPNGGACWSTAVVRGEKLSQNFLQMGEDFQYMELDDLDENAVWIIQETGEVFDITRPITEDLLLVQEQQPAQTPQQEAKDRVSTAGLVALLVLGVFAVFFVCLLDAELRRAAQERRKKRERN